MGMAPLKTVLTGIYVSDNHRECVSYKLKCQTLPVTITDFFFRKPTGEFWSCETFSDFRFPSQVIPSSQIL
jgi:hypothetical protein